jgi:hypothetical protein
VGHEAGKLAVSYETQEFFAFSLSLKTPNIISSIPSLSIMLTHLSLKTEYIVALAAVTALSCLTVVKFLRYSLVEEEKTEVSLESAKYETDGKTVLRLRQLEREGYITAPCISTITFFNGKVNPDALREKIKKIVIANPWLRHRILHDKIFNELAAVYPSTVVDPANDYMSDVFEFVCNPTITPTMEYEKLIQAVDKYLVIKGSEATNKEDVTQFKVTLIEIVKDKEYAVVMALSHVIADGRTFYYIYSMLDSHTEVTALAAQRKLDFDECLVQTIGERLSNWLSSKVFVFGILGTVFFRKTPKINVCSIDQKHLQQVKDDYSKSSNGSPGFSSFISTNDILTSWFFNLCGCQYGIMAVNLRNRFSAYTDLMAGNYGGITLYNRADYSRPEYIRESVSDNRRIRGKSDSVPTFWETLNFNISVISNWSTWYTDVKLSTDSECVLHLPILQSVTWRDLCIIFGMPKGKLGVLFTSRNVPDLDKLVTQTQLMKEAKEKSAESEGLALNRRLESMKLMLDKKIL